MARFLRISDESDEEIEMLIPKKVYLSRVDYLTLMSDRDLYKRFRFNRDSIRVCFYYRQKSFICRN